MAERKITLEQAQNQYVHRYTQEHVPKWTQVACNGKY